MSPRKSNIGVPSILVQIVHIEGPRKGEIDELSDDKITIGRDPESAVVFPRDLRIVSRHHAEIHREGNRYHMVNKSPNGSFVNGKLVEEAYLKQGDVLTFSKGGPKVSFLTSSKSLPSEHKKRPNPPTGGGSPPRPPAISPGRTPQPQPGEIGQFTVQYGTTIRSFKQATIRLGQERTNNFVIAHPRVYNKHAEIFYAQGQYYLKDLTENHQTLLNGKPIVGDSPLQENDIIQFSDGGPKLKYLGTGRFVEEVGK